jgi:hypothetical protein
MSKDSFRPVCPRCGDLCRANARRCGSCGADTGLIPYVRQRHRAHVEIAPRPVETTSSRYVVRETEGWRIRFPIKQSGEVPGIECVVLDTLYNHRQVASFTSESFLGSGDNSVMRGMAREAAATRCDLLNRLDEIARQAQGAVA